MATRPRPGHTPSRTFTGAPKPYPPGTNVYRVLAAEDAEDNRLLLTHYLRGEPVQLRFAENGKEAVDAIQGGEEFDLVLMDMDMPVLDGLSAVKAIRAWQSEHSTAHTPIIGLSANAMREAVRECLDAGCAAHVAKPCDRATLLGAIRRYARAGSGVSGVSVAVSESVAALVPKYLASKLGQVEEARANLAAKDFQPIRRFGHNLKGTGLGYGFPRIEEIGAEIENAALHSDQQRVSEQLVLLSRFLSEEHPAFVPVGHP
jgi:CheY-like chemotaxis protein/HPt (histidine-containing phosphotransfer) domain-containing protein